MYNENDDTVDSIEEKIVQLKPTIGSDPPSLEISCSSADFFDLAEKMSFDDQNQIFRAAADSNGLVGDA
tara:strand:+ start:355 stop:561 length:207 start_codon:yes stop_codon:yes gene_type:complete